MSSRVNWRQGPRCRAPTLRSKFIIIAFESWLAIYPFLKRWRSNSVLSSFLSQHMYIFFALEIIRLDLMSQFIFSLLEVFKVCCKWNSTKIYSELVMMMSSNLSIKIIGECYSIRIRYFNTLNISIVNEIILFTETYFTFWQNYILFGITTCTPF